MISEFPSPHIIAGWVIAATILAIWVGTYREEVLLSLRLWWARVPWIGTISRMQGNAALRGRDHGSVITRAERDLVAPYLPLVGRGLSGPAFQNYILYLKKAEDMAVDLKAPPFRLTLALLLGWGEGWAMALIITPWLKADVTALELQEWGSVLGYGLATLFFLMAHYAGELSRKAQHCHTHRIAWLESNHYGTLTPGEISPNEDQSKDNDRPTYEGFYARSSGVVRRWAAPTIMTVLVILGFLTMALRFVDQQREAQTIAGFQESVKESTAPASVLVETAATAAQGAFSIAGSTIAMLVFFATFLLVQYLGFTAGRESAANGKKTKDVVRRVEHCMSYDQYVAQRERRIARLQTVYSALQSGLPIQGRPVVPKLREVIAQLERERVQCETILEQLNHGTPATTLAGTAPALSVVPPPPRKRGRPRKVDPTKQEGRA